MVAPPFSRILREGGDFDLCLERDFAERSAFANTGERVGQPADLNEILHFQTESPSVPIITELFLDKLRIVVTALCFECLMQPE
jgi:hypothetical protein